MIFKKVSHGVPQSFVFGPLLFVLFINNMHNSVEYCKVHHYANDTNSINRQLTQKINRQVNCGLFLICHWLQANKINLNASKTEIIIFHPKNKQITKHLNFRISGQKISTCRNVKYLGVTLEENAHPLIMILKFLTQLFSTQRQGFLPLHVKTMIYLKLPEILTLPRPMVLMIY